MKKYYKTYNQARLNSKADDIILLDWSRGYYLTKPFLSKKSWNVKRMGKRANRIGKRWF